MMVFDQASRFNELEHVKLIATVGEEMTGDLLPSYRDDRPVVIPASDIASVPDNQNSPTYALSKEISSYLESIRSSQQPELFGLGAEFAAAPNSMAVSGNLTDSGNAYLANDPHMGVQAPSLWYEVGVHCITKSTECMHDFRGFSLPGVPGILIGHNDRIAWGLTNAAFDAEDLFIERINPENPNQYEVNGEWRDMDIRREEIVVRGWDEPSILFVRNTRNGVVATDELIGQDPFSDGSDLHVVSYAWTGLEPIRTIEAVLGVVEAQNWDDFDDALALFDAGKQNWIYADVDGNIGFIMPGKVPIRADFIVTANNLQIREDEYLYDLGSFQDRGQRAGRITNLIEALGEDITVQDLQGIQTDNASVGAQEIMPYISDIAFADPDLSAARDRLVNWDTQTLADSSEAALFAFFWQHLLNETYNDQLSEDLYVTGSNIHVDSMYYLLKDEENRWWDDIRTPNILELRDEILERALVQGFEEGVETLGEELDQWRWGDLHQITYRNATLGSSGIGLIEGMFNRGPFATSGSNADVIQKTCWIANESFDVDCIPALRQVVDLGELGNSTMIHNLGQSGHPKHKHYDDFVDPWRFFEYHPSNWYREDVEAGEHDTLVLEPSS